MLANQPSKTEISLIEDQPIGASLITTAKQKLPVILEDEGGQTVETVESVGMLEVLLFSFILAPPS